MRTITALVLTLAFAATTLHSEPAAARFGRSAAPGPIKMMTGKSRMVPARIAAPTRPPVPCDCSNCSAQHCVGRVRTVPLWGLRAWGGTMPATYQNIFRNMDRVQ
jgi:hypothetical protein